MQRFAFLFAMVALAGCGQHRDDSPIDPAPVAELQGQWLMVNRAVDCDTSYAVFGPLGIYRLFEGKPRKQYVTITKFLLEPGKITLIVKGLAADPDQSLDMVFAYADRQLRLIDILDDKGGSYKTPAETLEPADQAARKSFFRINEARFAMDRCVGS